MPMQALAGGLVPSSLYGGEHLLRLLQRLPALLPTGGLAPAALASIEAGLAHFLKFLLRHLARGPVCWFECGKFQGLRPPRGLHRGRSGALRQISAAPPGAGPSLFAQGRLMDLECRV